MILIARCVSASASDFWFSRDRTLRVLANKVEAAVIKAIVIAIAIISSSREKPPLVACLFDELIDSSLFESH